MLKHFNASTIFTWKLNRESPWDCNGRRLSENYFVFSFRKSLRDELDEDDGDEARPHFRELDFSIRRYLLCSSNSN
jgi:hypothetical protein